MSRPFTITTSWDDGDILDLRLADLLDRYDVKGTFYITHEYREHRLSEAQIRALSQRHEIGAHTMTHPILTAIPLQRVQAEIEDSKAWLEDVIGDEVTAFCYPRGAYNEDVRQLVIDTGYELARTVQRYQLHLSNDPFTMPTTLHCYPFPLRPIRGIRTRVEPIQTAIPHIRRLQLSPLALFKWESFAQALLERAGEVGGVWHLWGHSWEIERYELWGKLEAVLQSIRQLPGVNHQTNSELI